MNSCRLLCACACALASVAGAQQTPSGAAVNPFAPVSWQPAAPPPMPAPPAVAPPPAADAKAGPPAPPAPPPLPFRYLGRYSAAGVPLVFLIQNEHVLLARAGETIDGGWHVDSIAVPAIQFTYLPLQMKQSLATGDLP
jgi:hypothetical protein